MGDLKIWENPEFGTLRVIEQDGEPWMVGKDVAQALGYKDTVNALKSHVDDEDKDRWQITTQFGSKETVIINESGLYSLVLFSKLPTAKKFKRWVTSEVLPSIRKSGGYIAGQDQLTPEELMAKALQVANKTLAEREARISALTVQNTIMAPKAEYFDELVDRNTLTSFRDTAKELGIKPKAFVEWLLDKKFIFRDQKGKLMPREGKGDGLFEVKEAKNDKTQWSGVQTLVTPKGRETFRLLYL
nr:MAG TPA: repressor domain protein [Caudoviricetes sp.]